MTRPGANDSNRTPAPQPDEDSAIHPRFPVPKGVALAMGAGLLGLFLGGAAVAFTAAIAAPAIRERFRRAKNRKRLPPE